MLKNSEHLSNHICSTN